MGFKNIREPLGTSGLNEGVAQLQSNCRATGKEGEADHRRHKHSPEEKKKRRHACRIFRMNRLKKGTM
jgi:hypothetical protein